MKTSQWAAVSVAVIAINTLVTPRSFAVPGIASSSNPSTIPPAPMGQLSAYPSVVQTGTKPTLTWSILYPSSLSGVNPLVKIRPPGTLIPTTTVYATVQMVGNGVTAGNTTLDASTNSVDVRVSLDYANYRQLFYGTPADVVPSKQLYVKKLNANQTLDFGASYVNSSGSSPFYTTASSNMRLVSLVNGATIPTSFPLYQSATLKSYLKPYLNSTGTVNIGPLSVLVLMEIGQTNWTSPSADLQDVVLLVTFSKKHPNNGHGNNLDGVDSSNPGQGRGGPNGMVDPSGGVDDEIR